MDREHPFLAALDRAADAVTFYRRAGWVEIIAGGTARERLYEVLAEIVGDAGAAGQEPEYKPFYYAEDQAVWSSPSSYAEMYLELIRRRRPGVIRGMTIRPQDHDAYGDPVVINDHGHICPIRW
jgi:hypothetical protein